MRRSWLLTTLLILLPAAAFAAGGHDDLGCVGCHSIHAAEAEFIFGFEPNQESINPRTNGPYSGITALCLACHEETGGMGIRPVTGASSHPYGISVDPKVAAVPPDLLRDGRLDCVGCHDPHPSNLNHRYLRVDTAGGNEMQTFCILCHASKGERQAGAIRVFDSMDERRGGAPPPPPVMPPAD